MSDEHKITQSQYWREITALAKSIKKSRRKKKSDSDDEYREYVDNEATQIVDGHEWIIYTWAYPWVLMHSKHEDQVFEDQGPVQAENYAQIMQVMAYGAMLQDLRDELSTLLGI